MIPAVEAQDALNVESLKRGLPLLTAAMSRKSKKKQCQAQIERMQEKVLKNVESILGSREGVSQVFCMVSRECVEEITKVVSGMVTGGNKGITDYVKQQFGVTLPEGVDLGMLILLYHDSTCEGKQPLSDDDNPENGNDIDSDTTQEL